MGNVTKPRAKPTSKGTSTPKADRPAAQRDADPILAPPSAAAWEAWLRDNHAQSTGVLLKIPKKGADSTLTYATALDAALIWGWIDSQKQALDDTAWLQRFTPRKQRSPWSKINCAKIEALIAAGRMQAPGLAEVDRAKRDGRWERAYDSPKTITVPSDLLEALDQNARARAFFDALDATNRFAILLRVTTAKLPETRAKRIATFVAMCAANETLHPARTKAARAKSGPAKPTKRAQ